MKLPRLAGLWIRMASHMKAGLSSALQTLTLSDRFESLEKVPRYLHMQTLYCVKPGPVYQLSKSTRLFRPQYDKPIIKSQRNRETKENHKWEVVSEYDYTLNCAVRRVSGPLKVLVPVKEASITRYYD